MMGQTRKPITGTVVADDGQPLSDVMVYGRLERAHTTTNRQGNFRLDRAQAVIHFRREGFQPQSIVMKPENEVLRVTMHASTNSLVTPVCGTTRPGQKQLGWGKYGLQFIVPSSEVNISGGEPDVDYVLYVIRHMTGNANLELWFGPSSIDSDPDDKLFVTSRFFEQRNLVSADQKMLGIDSRGVLRDGTRWRQTAVFFQGGSIYRGATPQEADFLDTIVNSICQIPYPTQLPPLPPGLR
jgi:hypothetical protein